MYEGMGPCIVFVIYKPLHKIFKKEILAVINLFVLIF